MNKREEIESQFEDSDEIIFANGFDDAIIGVLYNTNVVVYSYSKAIDILCKDMTEDEAVDFLHFNTLGIGGEGMPIWVMDDII